MKKIIFSILFLFIFALSGCELVLGSTNESSNIESSTIIPSSSETFEDYGMNIIEISLDSVTITENGLYTSLKEVGVYLYTYEKLPSNFKTKANFKKSDYTSTNKLSTGGDRFYNREGLLPTESNRIYYECDIDYKGGSRNAKRIVYSNDSLIFYTSDHYSSFSILRFY